MTANAGSTVRGPIAYLEAAQQMAPLIEKLAPSIDRERRLPPELVEELRDAGLFHMLLPRALGGGEVDPVTAARVVEELSKADGATGWCIMIASQNLAFAGFLSEADVQTIWGNGGIVCGTARPTGRAVADTTGRGFKVSGHWPFASGSSHATWFAGECMVYDGETPRLDDKGEHVSRMVFLPRSEVTVHDTWDTLGLRGTASNDFSVEDAFVPAERGFQMLVTQPRYSWPLYRAFPLMFINHGSQSLGVARGALAVAKQTIAGKRGWGNVPLEELPRSQAAIAEATALVDSAAIYLYDAAQRLWDQAQKGETEPALRAVTRLATSHAVRASGQAVDILQAVLATSAIHTSNPLQRKFRDIHTAEAHVMIGNLTYEAAGRVLLGNDAAFPFF
jgi:alkylation response protein AidB-like acyl-CoA dehydrogenase